jgi:hypothetical protein
MTKRNAIVMTLVAALAGGALGRTVIGSASADSSVPCTAWEVTQWTPLTAAHSNGSTYFAPAFDPGTVNVPDGWEPFAGLPRAYVLRRCRL